MTSTPEQIDVDVLVVGAGFAGMYALKKLRDRGFSVAVLERGDEVGGTWYWNRYPGARCDIESAYYSYSFSSDLQQEWEWSEKYATQPEILAYLKHVADRFSLREDIRFGEEVISAEFQDDESRWLVRTGSGLVARARFVVMATGCLSTAKLPEIPGIEDFAGEIYHTSSWPLEGVDLAGKTVGLIGTGSSGIQATPLLAQQAAHLTVFQRTPNFSVPARNSPLDPDEWKAIKERYPELREISRHSASGSVPLPIVPVPAMSVTEEERNARYEERWRIGGMKFLQVFSDTLSDAEANASAADFIRRKIDEIVHDPAVAQLLKPTDHYVGTKRICTDTDYYETFNRDNVSLVDVKSAPISRISAAGVVTEQAEYPLDVLVFATGFDAMTGALLRPDIRGAGGESLRQKWEHGPRTYLGLATAGFPNLFMVTGPGSPAVLSNMVTSIEQHVEWISDHLEYLRGNELERTEPAKPAEDEWVEHVNAVADATLYAQANSWYTGANVPGKPRVFMPYVAGVGAYRDKCDAVAAAEYEGFLVS